LYRKIKIQSKILFLRIEQYHHLIIVKLKTTKLGYPSNYSEETLSLLRVSKILKYLSINRTTIQKIIESYYGKHMSVRKITETCNIIHSDKKTNRTSIRRYMKNQMHLCHNIPELLRSKTKTVV